MPDHDITALVFFAVALSIAAVVPGPAIAAIVGRVIARGTTGVTPFLCGLILSDVAWLTLAVMGLAVLAQTFQGLFLVLKYLGAAYLLWLAYRFWTTQPQSISAAPLEVRKGSISSFLGGMMVGLANPKAMMFYLALVPGFIPLHDVSLFTFAELSFITFAVLAIVFSTYVFAAARARRLLTNPRALAIVNRITSTVMIGAAVAVVSRS